MPPKQPPEPWHSFLSEIDSFLDEEVCLHCLGGFVITQLYGLERPTNDIDTISISPRAQANSLLQLAGEHSQLHHKYRIYLQAVGVCDPPEDYETRLTEMFAGVYKRLRLLALRLLARKIPFDLRLLRERFEKELDYLPNPNNRETDALELWIAIIEEDRASS
jgi:hypothetical protein